MTGLMRRDDDGEDGDDGLCGECRREVAVGPCGSCEHMICGGCGILSNTAKGQAVICTSCANLIAQVGQRQKVRGRLGPAGIAVAMIVLAAFAAASLLLGT